MSKKIWDFEGNGTDYITDVYKLLEKYKDGINNQQDTLIASIDISITRNSEALLTFKFGLVTIFEIITHYTGNLDLIVSYYNRKESFSININDLETKLDSVVKSKEMGTVIAYLIKLEKLRK
jgi:phosphoenolpyruvate carboxylase